MIARYSNNQSSPFFVQINYIALINQRACPFVGQFIKLFNKQNITIN